MKLQSILLVLFASAGIFAARHDGPRGRRIRAHHGTHRAHEGRPHSPPSREPHAPPTGVPHPPPTRVPHPGPHGDPNPSARPGPHSLAPLGGSTPQPSSSPQPACPAQSVTECTTQDEGCSCQVEEDGIPSLGFCNAGTCNTD